MKGMAFLPHYRFCLFLIICLDLFLILDFYWEFLANAIIFHYTSKNSSILEDISTGKNTNDGSNIAICLVGGARRFELTGPTIIKNILLEYPEADLFLHSPFDKDAFKFSILRSAPRIAGIRIFKQMHINETESHKRVLAPLYATNDVQRLLQYFNLVEGCLSMIKSHEILTNTAYAWLIRTRVDGYWSGPLDRTIFFPNTYLVPSGSKFGGLNDRFGVGDKHTSIKALSRLSLIPQLDLAGYRYLNSEKAFKSQLDTSHVQYMTREFPFCVMSDRRYIFPPILNGVPVASIGSAGFLSGAKCRPCKPACVGKCVQHFASRLKVGQGFTEWRNGSLELCDARGKWEEGWEEIFDKVAGSRAAEIRRGVKKMDVESCVLDFEEMRRKTTTWESPQPEEICRHGLEATST